MLTKFLRHVNRGKNLQATLDRSSYQNIPFEYSWNNLVKSYDLRMWYVQNSPHQMQSLQYTQELEKIHNELNYLAARGLMKRMAIFTLLFYGFYLFIFEAGNYDWSENWDPKHDLKMYGELEEGGDEGGDDD